MDTDKHGFKHGEITQKVIGVFYEVYNELGHGFLESVYEKSLEIALNAMGMKVLRQIETGVISQSAGWDLYGRYAGRRLRVA